MAVLGGEVEEEMRIRRCLPLLASVVTLTVAALPAAAQTSRPYNANPSSIKLRVGIFQPNGDSQYWDQREFDFTGDEDDFEDTIFGIDYTYMWTERFGFLVGASYWEGSNEAAFLD